MSFSGSLVVLALGKFLFDFVAAFVRLSKSGMMEFSQYLQLQGSDVLSFSITRLPAGLFFSFRPF